MGFLPNDAEASKLTYDNGPCAKCSELFDGYKLQGFLFFIIKDEYEEKVAQVERRYHGYSLREKYKPTPWQFFCGVSVTKPTVADRMKIDTSRGCAFVCESVAKQIGLLPE